MNVSIKFLLLMVTTLATSDLYANEIQNSWHLKAHEIGLGRNAEWRRILLYTPHWIGGMTSLADMPEFFQSPKGGADSDAELKATINGFFEPWSGEPNLHPICRYPRRLKFIETALNLKFPNKLLPECLGYKRWREEHPVEGMSLVFASNYLNNPASLYGHTFIRLHRTRDDGSGSSPLLDYAVNFAANPTTENAFLYPAFGLSGRFFGTFSLMPYYVKVQEYNNAESRDLFEYPLKLSPDEVDSFMQILWEAGPYGIRYWYMDDNCSYILLAMIEAAKTSLDVTETFQGVVSPKDTLLILKPHNILGQPVRRAAAMTRFNVRRADLSTQELELLTEQIKKDKLIPEIKMAENKSKARILDALIEWISWNEKLAGNRLAEKQASLWTDALRERSQLLIKSHALELTKHPVTPPEEGHPTHRTYLSSRIIEGKTPEYMFGLRLTLHDFESPPAGYSPEQETTMGDFQGVIRKNRQNKSILEWERFTFVRIVSAPAYDKLLPSPAWTLTAQTQRMWGYGRDSWLVHKFEIGAGIASATNTKIMRLWVIPVVDIGHLLPEATSLVHYGFGLRSGAVWDPSPEFRAIIGADADRWYSGKSPKNLISLYSTVSWIKNQKHELRTTLRSRVITEEKSTKSFELGWMRYF